MGVRAVPTELRWRMPRSSPPCAVVPCQASTGGSPAGRTTAGLTRGSASVVPTDGGHDTIPSVAGSSRHSPVAGCFPCAASCAAGWHARQLDRQGGEGRKARWTGRRQPGPQASAAALYLDVPHAPTGIVPVLRTPPALPKRPTGRQLDHDPGPGRGQVASTGRHSVPFRPL